MNMNIGFSPVYSRNNSHISYKGVLDKSFLNYMSELKSEVMQLYKSDVVKPDLKKADAVEEIVNGIIERLSKFIQNTNQNTSLVVVDNGFASTVSLAFKNMKTKARIRGWIGERAKARAKMVTPDRINIGMKELPRAQVNKVFRIIRRKPIITRSIKDIEIIDTWSKKLVEKVNPTDIDDALSIKYSTYKYPDRLWRF